jgi:hypothetical protein
MNLKTTSLLVLAAGILLSGCAENRGSVEAVAICSMPSDCTFGGKCDAYALGQVEYNPTGTEWLQFAVEIQNQLTDNSSEVFGRVNTNDAHITGYILEYDGVGPSSMTLDVGHQTIPADGTGVIWVYAAPPGSAVGNYTVSIRFFGYYDNDREFETPPFPVGLSVGTITPAPGCGTLALSCGSLQQNLYGCK